MDQEPIRSEEEIRAEKKAKKLALKIAARERSKLKRKEEKRSKVKPFTLNVPNDTFEKEKKLAIEVFEEDRSRAGMIDPQIMDFVGMQSFT